MNQWDRLAVACMVIMHNKTYLEDVQNKAEIFLRYYQGRPKTADTELGDIASKLKEAVETAEKEML